MKNKLLNSLALATLFVTPLRSSAATFFSDTFGSGSTLNSTTPAAPTATNASYQLISGKNWSPAPSIAAGHLQFGIASTSSGSIEVQAQFAPQPIGLVNPGDYVQLVLTFTDTAGILTLNSPFGVGLYNSGGTPPIAGGLNSTATSSYTTNINGGAQLWLGYVAQIGYSGSGGSSSRFYDRKAQTVTPLYNNDQDLVTTGSGSMSYKYPAASGVGSASSTASVTLTAGSQYTEVLTYTLNGDGSLTLDSELYNGTDTNAAAISSLTATTGTTPLTTAFDSLALGWRAMTSGSATAVDINSITVSGQGTIVVPQPPVINTQPASISVASGSLAYFSVDASGTSVTYQWQRYGTNLVNGGNISGATTPTLIVAPVSAADVASGANGYSVKVTSTGGITNSTPAALSLRTAANLTWAGSSTVWDLGSTPNWNGGTVLFNQGDAVTFDDSDTSGALNVDVTGSYLSPSTITVNANDPMVAAYYKFQGSGSIAGPAELNYIGASPFTIANANTYTGGTLISNAAANLYLNNQAGLGSGPVTLAAGQLTLTASGGSAAGLGDVIVANDFTIEYDANHTYGAVILGNLSGTPGKTLTFIRGSNPASSRIRVGGTNTVYNANLNLSDPSVQFAPYENSGSQTYNGVISGYGNIIQRGGGTAIFTGANTYSGGTTPSTGTLGFGCNTTTDGSGNVLSGPIGTGPLFLAPENGSTSGSGTVLAFGGPRTIANPLQYLGAATNLTLIVGGTNALTFSGPYTLQGNDFTGGTNRTLQVANTALTTISGQISDGGLNCGLTKTGNGVLALTATETYTGQTTVSAGTLQVNGSLNAASAVTVATNGILAGTGTINGPVTVAAGGNLAAGTSAIGTLTLNNNLSLAGNLQIKVSKSASPASDKLVVNGTLANSGAGNVVVTNLGGMLNTGDTFTLFNKALANGNALTVTGGGVSWTNKLAIDGTIQVLGPLTVPGPVFTAPIAGTNITVNPGATLSLANTATGATPPVTYSLLNGPTNASLDAASGLLTWRPLLTQANSANSIRVVATDSGSPAGSSTNSYTITVGPVAPIGVSTVTAPGQVSLTVSGGAGPDYAVLVSSNLTTWSTLFITNTPSLPFTWTDTNTQAAPMRFYRIKAGPPLP